MSADQAIGAKVNQLMFVHRATRKQLGEALGCSGPAVSKKIYGQSSWSVEELYAMAEFFDIDITDLLPQRVSTQQETPDFQSEAEGSRKVVAGAGFEPTTSGL